MNNILRKQVLASFKKLHLTRKNVFKGDETSLAVARKHINDEYVVHKNETDEKTISNLVKYAEEIEEVIRKTVIQAVKTKDGNYRAVMRKDIQLLDTASPYKPMPDEMIGPFKKGKRGMTSPCPEEKK